MKYKIIFILFFFMILIISCNSKQLNKDTNILQFRLVNDTKNDNNTEFIMKNSDEKLFIDNEILLNLAEVKNISKIKNNFGLYSIEIIFNKTGKIKFEQITKNNIEKRLGLILDNELLSAPIIRSKIISGKVSFGNYTVEELESILKKFFQD